MGRDSILHFYAGTGTISIHVPLVVHDSRSKALALRITISIHVPRVGHDGNCPYWSDGSEDISIHAPRVGRDEGVGQTVIIVNISIHAPRVGRD